MAGQTIDLRIQVTFDVWRTLIKVSAQKGIDLSSFVIIINFS